MTPSKPQAGTLAIAALSLFTLLTAIFIVLFPERAFKASLDGLTIWWKIVFPALLPYLVFVRLFTDSGAITWFARLLQPLMRTAFRLPGAGSRALASGLIAGWPAGADTVMRLVKERQLTVHEAERLLALSHSVNPVVAVHVIAVGLLNNVKLGWFLLTVHIASLWCTGIFLRIRSHRHESIKGGSTTEPPRLQAQQESVGFGKRLGDAVLDSIQMLLKIGGTIMIFSVLITVAELAFEQTWALFGISLPMVQKAFVPLISAVSEIHWGAYQLSQFHPIAPLSLAIVLSAMLAWSGMSAHLQVQSIVRDSGMRYLKFVSFRLVHAAFAAAIAWIAWPWAEPLITSGVPSGSTFAGMFPYDTLNQGPFFPIPEGWWWMCVWAAFVIILFFLLSALCAALNLFRRSGFRRF